MKRTSRSVVAGIAGILWASVALALPVDLSTFTVFPDPSAPVSVAGNSFTLAEDPSLALVSLFNDTFAVGAADQTLSFDYSAVLDSADPADTFLFLVNGGESLAVNSSTDGHFALNLTPFQNTSLALEWQLVWGGDPNDPAGSVVTVSNVDLQSRDAAPVPEPGSLLLLGSGLIGLGGWARKRSNRG